MTDELNGIEIPEFDFDQLLKSHGLDEQPRSERIREERQEFINKHRDHPVIHLLKKVNVQSTIFCIFIPLFSLFKLLLSKPECPDSLLCCLFWFWLMSALSLVAGYHRFFTHNSYQCHIFIQFMMAIIGASCGLGSILDFSSQHMVHHRHVDTIRDPHSRSVYGWLFSQWGHRFFQGNRKSRKAVAKCRETVVSMTRATYDNHSTLLLRSPSYSLLIWQDSNYVELWILTNIIVPCLIAKYVLEISLWHCVFYLGFVKMSVVQQHWLLISSLCHWKRFPLSSQPFDDSRSPINLKLGLLGDLLTFGESNHNFHHEFPGDYRNGRDWYIFDPAKWFIYVLRIFKLANNLHQVSDEQVVKCLVQQQQKTIDEETSKLTWGIPIDRLPHMSAAQFARMAKDEYLKNRKAFVAIDGIVHDVTPFIHDHPGGVALVEASIGKDATQAFNGAVYRHSNAARNLLSTMRVAIITDFSSSVEATNWDQRSISNLANRSNNDGQDVVRNRRHVTFTRRNFHAAGAA